MQITRKNNFIQPDKRQQISYSAYYTAPRFNYASKDTFAVSKQGITFAGLFNFFKKKKSSEAETLHEEEQPQKIETDIPEQPEVSKEEPETVEKEPEITCLEVIRGPYIQASENQIKYLHNKRLKEVLSNPSIGINEIAKNRDLIGKLVNSENFNPDIKILLPDDEEEASIFDDLKYYQPAYQAALLINMFGKDDKPVDEKHKLSYEFIVPLLDKFNKLVSEDPETYQDKVLNFYKKQLDFENTDEMIADGFKNSNYHILKMLRENGVSGDTLVTLQNNPDKKITFAEAAALSGNKKIRKLFPIAQALNNSIKRISDDAPKDTEKILNIIRKLPVDEFADVINDLNNYNLAQYSGDKIILIMEKISKCNSKEEFELLKPHIDSCFFKPCEKISKEKALASNDWALRLFLTENHHPQPYVVDYFRDNILNNPNIDINYKGRKESKIKNHSILEIALTPYYQNPYYALDFIAEIMLKGADTIDFKTDLRKDIYNSLKDYHLDKIEEKFGKKIYNNPETPQRKGILNFYKQYYAANGKSNFFNTINNYEFAKLLIEAGVKPETKDNKNNSFIEFAKSLKYEDGNKLFTHEEVIKALINLNNPREMEQYFFEELLKDRNDINKMQKKYFEFHNILEANNNEKNKINVLLGKGYLKSKYKEQFERWFKPQFSQKEIEDKFITAATSSLNAKKLSQSSDYEVQKSFASVYYDFLDVKNKEKYLDKIVELGITGFSIHVPHLEKASKMALDKFFDKHPDLKDGIYSMDDFIMLCRSDDFCKYAGFNVPVNEQEETLIDIFINIPPASDIKQKRFFVDTFNDTPDFVKWDHTDKFGNNYAIKAVEAENIPMIKLLQEKNVDFSIRNKFGKNAIELGKESPNPVIRELFSNIKINSEELINLAKMGSTAGMKMLLEQEYIDVNSKNAKGLNSWLISAQQNKASVADFLKDIPEVDFSAKTKDGNNFAMTAIYNNSEDIITEIFPKLTPEQLDLNYINEDKKNTVYDIAARFASPKIFETILNLKSADPNICNDSIMPIAFQLITFKDKVRFKILCESGKLDTSAKFLNLSLQDYIKTHMLPETQKDLIDNLSQQKEFLEILSIAVDKEFLNNIKKIVEENGVISMQNINEFLDYPNIKNIIKSALSDSDEKIGHLLTDIEVTPENMFQILNLTQRILKLDKDAFTYRDKFGQSPAERALLAENEIVYEIITQNSSLTGFDIEKLQKIALNVKNPKIKKITLNLKPSRRSD